PGRVIETNDWRFDVEDFAAAGRCTVRHSDAAHAQQELDFRGEGKPLHEDLDSGFLDVTWEGQRLEVLQVRWETGGSNNCVSWITGASYEAAEAFFRAVCAFNSVVRPSLEVLVFEGGGWRKSTSLHAAIRRASFDELVLPGPLLAQLRADFTRFF